MSADALDAMISLCRPHALSLGLIALRLIPIAFLCPLLGGPVAPITVRLGVVLSLACALHFAAGVTGSPGAVSALQVMGSAGREVLFGLVIGLVSALPFDAARMGGRFIDLFRGSSAEASLPGVGTREAASGDLLHQLTLAVAVTAGALPWVLKAIFQSFAAVPLGTGQVSEHVAMEVVHLVGTAFAAGLAIGAPVAAATLLVDALLGLVTRAAPQLRIAECAAPLRILLGGGVLWAAVGLMTDRLLIGISALPATVEQLSHFVR